MKRIQVQLISVAVGVFALATHWSHAVAEDDVEDVNTNEVPTLRSWKSLTPQEEALANEARAHIAKTIENNLVRLFAVISAQPNDRRGRQEEGDGGDDGEDITGVTPNPNVLPQVAQILGAIFSGSLNISRVVDRTFGLVPNLVRNQVGGLVKLLTGENMMEATAETTGASATLAATTAAVTAPPPPVVATSPPEGQGQTSAPSVYAGDATVIVEKEEATTSTAVADKTDEIAKLGVKTTPKTPAKESISTEKTKYRIKNRTRPSTTPIPNRLEDDEIDKLEEEIRRAARAYEPYVSNKEPRVYAGLFQNIFGRVNFNSTPISSAVPSIFQGARQAFVILENLGVLDVSDVLDELGIAPAGPEEPLDELGEFPDEEEEEEEE